jgi:ribonucleotide reductase alpha subunit
MPTASTAQILGNNESFEPYTQNLYVRRAFSGEFVTANRHLVRDLIKCNLWCDDLRQKLIANNGSVQNLEEIPPDLKQLYKTAWEIKQRAVLDMAADRGAYIDQSQSLNIHMTDATTAKLSSMHFHGWQRGLKTGMYYLRTKAAVDAIKFTVDVATARKGLEQVRQEEPSKVSSAGGYADSNGTSPTPYPSQNASTTDSAAHEAARVAQALGEPRFQCISCGS